MLSVRTGDQLINGLITDYERHVPCDKIFMLQDKNVEFLDDIT